MLNCVDKDVRVCLWCYRVTVAVCETTWAEMEAQLGVYIVGPCTFSRFFLVNGHLFRACIRPPVKRPPFPCMYLLWGGSRLTYLSQSSGSVQQVGLIGWAGGWGVGGRCRWRLEVPETADVVYERWTLTSKVLYGAVVVRKKRLMGFITGLVLLIVFARWGGGGKGLMIRSGLVTGYLHGDPRNCSWKECEGSGKVKMVSGEWRDMVRPLCTTTSNKTPARGPFQIQITDKIS